jgi:cobalt-zinc-cadmium efflux system membrane fusion protein
MSLLNNTLKPMLALLAALLMLLAGCDQKPTTVAADPASKPAAKEDHAGEKDAHDEEGEHADEEAEHAEDIVRLTPEAQREFAIQTAIAGPGHLEQWTDLPGEIVLDADRVAHVVPRVAGIVRQVNASIGDTVRAGAVLAVIDSRELADAKAAYLASRERLTLAESNAARETRLWEKQITSEQEFLSARQAQAEARIELRSAQQKLIALGCSEADLARLPEMSGHTYTRYEIKAPTGGAVIEKHITLGESLKEDTEAFTLADLSRVWVDIQVYQKDLAAIRPGQPVVIVVGHGIPDTAATLAWVGPLVGEATRTALARVVLNNPDGVLRPGTFVTAKVATGSDEVPLVIPRAALQSFEGSEVVFIETEEGFVPTPVTLGRGNAAQVEVLAGLQPGQTYVSQGAFTLKAQLSKGAFGDGHNH